jgi:hypothetical protein
MAGTRGNHVKVLVPLYLSLMLAAPAVPMPSTPPAKAIGAPTDAANYPAWLEMKPGYAEACMQGGGCIPMTQGELQELANVVRMRTMDLCRRNTI